MQVGVLRLRDCFAKRSSHSAQDDTTKALSRLQHQLVGRFLLDRASRIQQRKVLSLTPERYQIGIVWTSWLAALAGHVHRNRVVPIAEIENFAIARA